MVIKRLFIVFSVFAILLFLLEGTQVLASGLGNIAMLAYLDVANEDYGARSGTVETPEPTQLSKRDIDRSLILLKRAVNLDPESTSLHWSLIRVSLKIGHAPDLMWSIVEYLPDIRSNAWFYQDLLVSHSVAGHYKRVISLFETVPPPQVTDVIRDTVALAYLEVDGERALKKAEELRPGDLYVSYSLWQAARESNDRRKISFYRELLEQFPLSAVLPTDSRLLRYTAAVIPDLFSDGVWDKEKTLNVVSLLVWQYYPAEGVLRLTERLSKRFASDPDWLFYQAEVYHRRGELKQAERLYHQLIALDPTYSLAYLRIGMAIEAQQGSGSWEARLLRQALDNYQQYHVLAGDDLLGSKRVQVICTKLASQGSDDEQICDDIPTVKLVAHKVGSPDEQIVPVELMAHQYNDLRAIITTLLNLSEEQLELGPNLIENGGFENWVGQGLPSATGVRTRPQWWSWVEMFDYAPFRRALFVGGADDLAPYEGKLVARVDGEWSDHGTDQATARAGFWQIDEQTRALREVELPAKTAYLLTFVYRTERVADGRTTVWAASADEPGSLWSESDPLLPATDGAWYRFMGIGWNDTSSIAVVRPLLRLYSTGAVSFDDVRLKPIYFSSEKPDNTEVQVFVVRGGREQE